MEEEEEQVQEAEPVVPGGQARLAVLPGLLQLQERALMFLGGHMESGEMVSM